jgi:hypothetical protein
MKQMNPKKFKLPQEFWEKWKEALLSENYKQGSGNLCFIEAFGKPLCTHCCLGVAAEIAGNPRERLENVEFIYAEGGLTNIPRELISAPEGDGLDDDLSSILSALNDGMYSSSYNDTYKKFEYNYRVDIEQHFSIKTNIKYDFKQIVEFIEDNVEFY